MFVLIKQQQIEAKATLTGNPCFGFLAFDCISHRKTGNRLRNDQAINAVSAQGQHQDWRAI